MWIVIWGSMSGGSGFGFCGDVYTPFGNHGYLLV